MTSLIETMPNLTGITHKQTHIVDLPAMCPVSKNPRVGSKVTITYTPKDTFLEVYSLAYFIQSFAGGATVRGVFVRDMEQVIQILWQECETALGVPVFVRAELLLDTQVLVLEVGQC